ncbi:hypothetical protein EVAR_29901_1 [Eumeta japonica]|uniref:Uncharacterized protein n=1 Tax=Eumeta variegata TaxID=151549 RepID=A0A4C1V7Q2_EUMVA|nr:hypothetical protein EVAR_29901_1 [Eumeta japonica]
MSEACAGGRPQRDGTRGPARRAVGTFDPAENFHPTRSQRSLTQASTSKRPVQHVDSVRRRYRQTEFNYSAHHRRAFFRKPVNKSACERRAAR